MRDMAVVGFTIFVAMFLALLPMPDWTAWARPAWVLMVLIFWTMTVPSSVNVGVAWISGIILDLLTGTMFGEHALAFVVVTYLVYRLHLRLKMYPILQQSMTVLIFVLISQFIIFCLQGFIGELPRSQMYWLSSVSSMLLWPWLYILLRDYCDRCNLVLTE